MENSERDHMFFLLSSEYETFRSMSIALDNKIKRTIKETLHKFPAKTANFPSDPAFVLVEGDERWFETGIYGIRYCNGVLEYSLETVTNEKGVEETSWNKHDVHSEHEKHSSVNWLSVLDSLKDSLI